MQECSKQAQEPRLGPSRKLTRNWWLRNSTLTFSTKQYYWRSEETCLDTSEFKIFVHHLQDVAMIFFRFIRHIKRLAGMHSSDH